MIESKSDFLHYLEQGKRALNVKSTLKNYLTHDIWRFQVTLRKLEYIKNTARTMFGKIYAVWLQLRVRK